MAGVGGAGGADAGDDAAAGCGDLGVADAGEALLELGGAVAAEDQVGVAVDEAGGDPAAGAVDAAHGAGRAVGRAGIDDAPVPRRHRATLDRGARHGEQPRFGPDNVRQHRASLHGSAGMSTPVMSPRDP